MVEGPDLSRLSRMVEEQQRAIGALGKELLLCREEVGALRECLVSAGLLDRVRFLAQLHRRRFAAACARYGQKLGVRVDAAIDVRAVALSVGVFAGVTAMRSLCRASSVMSPAVKDILRTLCPGEVYVCGGFEGALALSSVERLNPRGGTWEPLPQMTEARQYTCAGVVSGCVFVCGGWGGPQPVRSVECFNPSVGAWEAMPSMIVARWGAAAGVMGGRLHICGGLDETRQPLGSVERLDPTAALAARRLERHLGGAAAPALPAATAVWEAVPNMSQRRGWPAAGVLGGWLYVCGGRDELREPLNSVERLGPSATSWEGVPAMHGQRAGAAAAAACRRLYVCGGAFGAQMLSSAERYDPKAKTWEVLQTMAARRAYVAAVAVDGKLYVFGGSDGNTCLGSAELFDPVQGVWSPLGEMSERRSGSAAASVIF